MSRLILPQVQAPRSPHLVLFEEEFESLNAFYWVFKSSSALMLQQAPGFLRVTDFVPRLEAAHLDISTQELAMLVPRTELIARYGFLVQVITYYEVFLGSILSDVVVSRWPGNRQVTLKLRPSELPPSNLDVYIKSAAVAAEVGSVIDEGYNKRSSRITNLLTSSGFPPPSQTAGRSDLVAAACEVRNCIVHAGGKIDQRAFDALKPQFPTVQIGAEFDLSESDLWRLIGAVRDDARAIDYAIRKQASDRRIAKWARRKRYAMRKKAAKLAQAQRYKAIP